MEDTLRNFRKRQMGIRRKHERMARGYVNKLDRNGVIVQKPDNKSGNRLFRSLLLVGLCLLAFKVFLLAGLGTETYLSHVAELQSGSSLERAGAWVMQIDPATSRLAELLTPFLS